MAEQKGKSDAFAPDWLERLTARDFDGHTEFSRMTAEQRIAWLSSGARFLVGTQRRRGADASPGAAAGLNPPGGPNPLSRTDNR